MRPVASPSPKAPGACTAGRGIGIESDADWAAAVLAVDPVGIGGVVLRGPAGPARDQWLAQVAAMLAPGTPLRRMPAHIDDDRLLGGLDLVASLHTGHAVLRRGLLAEADGGVLVLAMAERMAPALAARLAAAVDARAVSVQRDGLSRVLPARVGLVALDEGERDDEHVPAALAERLAVRLCLPARPPVEPPVMPDLGAARERLAGVRAGDDIITALCEAAAQLGIGSARAPWLALRVACAAAALNGRLAVEADDAALAARLVLAQRATAWPGASGADDAAAASPDEAAAPPDEPGKSPTPSTPPADEPAGEGEGAPPEDGAATPAAPEEAQALDDRLLAAVASALPAGLLLALAGAPAGRGASTAPGRAGAGQRSWLRGRPIGAQRAPLRGGARLDLLQTLRAAAPWQALRRRELGPEGSPAAVLVRREDFHVRRFKLPNESTTIFAVDASGSQALHRLGEAKGAVELLLADCYVRRDRVALVAFRGRGADLLLPPTRSLVRAKRCLADLPGGGGTPLAAGIDSARTLAEAVLRSGGTPLVVLLTDGRANVTRQGHGGRDQAGAEALAAARALGLTGVATLFIDTGRPADTANAANAGLAGAMGARYLLLPHADAASLAQAVARHAPNGTGAAARPSPSRHKANGAITSQ